MKVELNPGHELFVELAKKYTIKSNTNLFLLGDSIERLITNETIVMHNELNWIIFLKDQDFYRMYFNISYDYDIDLLKKEFINTISKYEINDLVCEFVSKRKKDINNENILLELGFSPFIDRERLVRRNMISFDLENTNYEIVKGDLSYLEEIDFLYRETFDKYTSCIKPINELEDAIREEKIYLAISKRDKELMGVIEFSLDKKVTEIVHLVVKEDFRGLGIGNALVNYYIKEFVDKNNFTAKLWVKVDNEIAKKTYEKFGYLEERVYSYSYLLKGDKNV